MLRLYKPIKDDIFKLHNILEGLVCNVWCKADNEDFDTKASDELSNLLDYSIGEGKTFRSEINRIYEIFKELSPEEKGIIKNAWSINNEIEKLCNKEIVPIPLQDMPEVVEKDIKPLFKWCYEYLLGVSKVKGDKLAYYRKLIEGNGFKVCPCCGLIDFEAEDSSFREDYDHYLPKKLYPLASVNFKNLVPLCSKCNQDRKKAKNPIESDRKAFYPFSETDHYISIKFKIDSSKDLDNLTKEDLKITFEGNEDKIKTWDWLFDIEERYSSYIRSNAKTILRGLKKRHRRNRQKDSSFSFFATVEEEIEDYNDDKYSDKKFLKIALFEELKNQPEFLAVYL